MATKKNPHTTLTEITTGGENCQLKQCNIIESHRTERQITHRTINNNLIIDQLDPYRIITTFKRCSTCGKDWTTEQRIATLLEDI